ncbi:hypothetical protein KC343_g2499 [Hortaea werneckii]|uniref:Cell wall galactomannoprotein n=1 Tax=Hortaea werneckii TaxID=91943 RepID=A0A3M7CSN8_HORWE|nr:hypothetical protein KC352_g8044 [Hortaea werneckii]KAI7571383.1 hypothetical protein KC317_g1675 [Hortaea werneckii]KAI7622988.1 hypothetical protein KC346_g2948 [Hortaea werneckii]KAI7634250.1 hypothetical protein KC343_g2499 [Hortaea werneckii]KAI7680146.1 hypothetical protein KC319_g2342 [Hortaea werneckii]
MHFSKFFSALALTSAVSGAAIQTEKRAISADQMVNNIKKITQLSQDLQPKASAISTDGVNFITTSAFEPVINGFQQIIRVAQNDIDSMSDSTEYTAANAQPVCDAFSDFVVVHQELLRILIGKSGLLESVFLGPVAAVLRSLEEVVDALAFGVISSVPSCQADATEQKRDLDDTLSKATCAYTPGGTLIGAITC